MTVTQDKDTKKTIITTDYKGSRWPQRSGASCDSSTTWKRI